MADVVIRGITYTGVAKLGLDKSGGGSALYYDIADADAVASDILTGKKAYGSSGLITGTKQPPSGSISITENGVVDVTDYASAIVNVSSGGGGPTASDAILLVTVPTGSVVTMTKGADTRVPTMWVSAADPTKETALFVVEPADFDSSPWTVTAVSGADTDTTTVTIDSNKQFGLDMFYWNGQIYIEGNEYARITGGLTPIKIATNYAAQGTLTRNASSISLITDGNGSIAAATMNKVDVTGFSTLNARITEDTVNSTSRSYIFLASSLTGISMNAGTGFDTRIGISGTGNKALSIASFQGEYYIGVGFWYAGARRLSFDRVWLE